MGAYLTRVKLLIFDSKIRRNSKNEKKNIKNLNQNSSFVETIRHLKEYVIKINLKNLKIKRKRRIIRY